MQASSVYCLGRGVCVEFKLDLYVPHWKYSKPHNFCCNVKSEGSRLRWLMYKKAHVWTQQQRDVPRVKSRRNICFRSKKKIKIICRTLHILAELEYADIVFLSQLWFYFSILLDASTCKCEIRSIVTPVFLLSVICVCCVQCVFSIGNFLLSLQQHTRELK